MNLPLLLLVNGPPASGKTTLATRLAHELRVPLVAKDAIEERLYEEVGTDRCARSRVGGKRTRESTLKETNGRH